MVKDDDTAHRHPVPAGVRALRHHVDAVAGVLRDRGPSLDAAAAREALVAVCETRAVLDSLTLALAAHGEAVRVGAESGATSTGVWWAVATRQNRRSATGLVALATALERTWHQVHDALAEGTLSLDQARVIVHALEDLPEDLPAWVVPAAEQTLVDLAAVHDPDHLRVLGQRILATVAPEVGEEADRKKLEQAEREARRRRKLTLSFDGHGAAHGRFTLPEVQGKMLEKLLLAFAAPGHVNATQGPGTWAKGRPTAGRMGEAFGELIETYPRDRTPRAGGVSATLVTLMDLDALRTGLGTATLDTGGTISAGEARRLACEAGIIPAVLDSEGNVLDLGRKVRFHTEPQRIALMIRDGGCTAEGCDWPPGLCHVHHENPWARGGHTNTDAARLLCPHHHTRVHDPTYEVTVVAGGKLRFHRRT